MTADMTTDLQPRPAAVTWFLVYCGVLCFLYLGVVAIGIVFLSLDPAQLDQSRMEALVLGGLFTVVGAACLVASALPFFLPRRPWVWIYDLVIICMGMTSACFLPASIPLLIFWMKPEVKTWFGRPA